MTRARSLHFLGGLFALAILLPLDAAQAWAAPSPPAITRRLLDKREVVGAPGLETQLWLIEYPPGTAAPVHHHPVVGIGYVVEGEFESAFGHQPPVRVKAGQSFVDPARVEHRLFRNVSAERPLKFLVTYTIPAGQAPVEMGRPPHVELRSHGAPATIAQPALYPETIEADPRTGKFLVGSVREGAIYEVGLDGATRRLVQDDRLTSILGLVADPKSNRLLVTNSDLGVGVRRSSKGARREAGVGIYDLTSGRLLRYVDLTPLRPGGDHLMNGITVDGAGNAYVTDSFSPVIYRIDPAGVATVFLTDHEFEGAGINLNGIVYHPKGFLLAVKKNSGALYRIPLDDPRHFARVDVSATFVGADGLLLASDDSLVVIANQTPAASSNAAFVLRSRDDWATAQVMESKKLGAVYPTTCVALAGKVYLLSSHLDELIGTTGPTLDAVLRRSRRGEIQEIGVVSE